MKYTSFICLALCFICFSCDAQQKEQDKSFRDTVGSSDKVVLKPVIITEKTQHDTDDPAIWINSKDVSKSLIIGTDKHSDGALYVYDLQGKIIAEKTISGLKRPNNVDVAYNFILNNKATDIAVVTERETNKIRIYTLPDMKPVDNGGIEVFVGEAKRSPMGISLYTRPSDKAIFAVVSRKSGPETEYLWQYRLSDNGNGKVKAELVRKFGNYSSNKEIESIAIDNQLGYVYYSDEGVGVRKYHADPDKKTNSEISIFGLNEFKEDAEGISIYTTGESTGYILVSNQQANTFLVFRREGEKDNPHQHKLLAEIPLSTLASDGSDVTSINLGADFPKGMFVAMSEGRTFHFYDWRDIEAKINKAENAGQPE
ncbi:phytase [uncultured Pontibacter sp.]|uniref:phytase n=1 Tax=uncultured Pontibacter sp. TaxID=453356 RepID=UPI0026322598|nr:phytase [uncultured Pontibacter sp.]